jgi:integrase
MRRLLPTSPDTDTFPRGYPVGTRAENQISGIISMARKRLTKRAIDAATARDGADVYLFDSDLKGFGLRVRPSGAKTFIVQFRAGKGRGAPKRRFTIGAYGSPWTVDTARTEARRLLGQVADGGDPSADKSAEKRNPTLEAFAEAFLRDHVEAKRRARTAHEYADLLNRVVLPVLGKHRLADIARANVAKLHHDLRATPYQANRAIAVLSKLMNWAERHGYRPDGSNPCRHVERFPEHKRERFLSEAELSRLAAALKEAEADGAVTMHAAAAIKLLVFTGARLREVLGLRWDWLSEDGTAFRLPDSKTGAKTLRLNAPAREVLASLPRVAGNDHVVPGHRDGQPIINLQKPWRRVRDRAGLLDVRLHDLRHTFASVAAAGGNSLVMIGKLLGHTQAQTTQRYAHLAADPVRQANETIGQRLAAAMNSEGAAPVVPLPSRRA